MGDDGRVWRGWEAAGMGDELIHMYNRLVRGTDKACVKAACGEVTCGEWRVVEERVVMERMVI